MKKLLLIVTVVLTLTSVHSQTPNWAWTKSVGDGNFVGASSATTDGTGNIYVTGIFSDTVSFDGDTLTPGNNIFIVKYNSNGNILWAKSANGNNSYVDERVLISSDHDGNIYVAGSFQSDTIAFGSQILTNADNPGSPRFDVFIAKFDSTGNVIWARKAGGRNQDDKTTSLHIDKFGNAYITGYFLSDTLLFDTTALIKNGGADIFLAKYKSNGDLAWAIRAGGKEYEEGSSITTDTLGNIYLVGRFSSDTILFNSTQLYNNAVPYDDMYIVKYDTNANLIWAKNAGGFDNWAYSVASDFYGNIYVTGDFVGDSIILDNFTLFNTATSFNSSDIFVVKYDYNGNVIWAKSVGGNSLDYSSSITTDVSGNIYITGNFQSDSLYFGSTLLTRSAGIDLFLVKYDAFGNEVWGKSAGGSLHDQSSCVISDSSNNIFIVGYFSSSSIIFDATTLIKAGIYDMFIAKLGLLSGIEGLESNNYLKIFPNPFSSMTTLQTVNLFKNATLTVYNSFGQIVKRIKNISGQTITLQRDNLPSGLYFIRLTEDSKVFVTKKLLITD